MSCSQADHTGLRLRGWHLLIPLRSLEGLAYANCPRCHSTLCKPLPVAKFWLCRRDHVVRCEHIDGHQAVYNIQDGCIPDLDDEAFERAVWAAWDGDGDDRFQGWDRSESAAQSAVIAAHDARTEAA